METKKIRTRQEIKRGESNPKGKDFLIGLDLGYSSTKVFYEGGHFCFPSYARVLTSDIEFPDPKDIRYLDEASGETYLIGYNAQNMVGLSETNETDAEFYSRKRYSDHRFRILCNAAVALAVQDKVKAGDKRKVLIQTGLPSSYLEGDAKLLKKAIMNHEPFSLSVGGGPWVHYQFDFSDEDISVIAQPVGALYSAITRGDGKLVQSNNPDVPDARRILTGRVLVLDAGFGTFDFYGMVERIPVCQDSVDDIGMRAVLELALKMVREDTDEDIRIAALQPVLSSGQFYILNEEEMSRTVCSIAPYIDRANAIVFERAKNKIRAITHSLQDYDNVIVDGGTGEAWFDDLKKWLANMNLHIFPSNFNDHLSMIYSNARGYYMFLYGRNRRGGA